MPLVSLRSVQFGFGRPPLLEGAELHIDEGERICLVGRNGVGKSTLLKLIHGDLEPDAGQIARIQGLSVALLEQEVPVGLQGRVRDFVAEALGPGADENETPETPDQWRARSQVEKVLSQIGLDPEARIEALSSGLKRRVLLARELVKDPDLLLLDEPTNHLDINAITWLEDFLYRYTGTLLFVTHDRAFLRRLATRIVDLDSARLTSFPCDYETYLVRKEELLTTEAAHRALFDRKLAQEEAWIRQGVKERRTRNQGRVRALIRMREERRARRERPATVRMEVHEAERSGRLVIKARQACFAYGAAPVVDRFSTTIYRGDRVGIVGPNGSGKTTLLRLLLGELPPQEGTVRHGARLAVAYFDQLRGQLSEDRTVVQNVGEGRPTLIINGRPREVTGYLGDFLFTPDRARTLVSALSGGERNRLLLARLFAKPSNVLVMDEPTNDLDMETLELLEGQLLQYTGTVLLVSHDRTFLDNVVTTLLICEEGGRVREFIGGYDDWLQNRQERTAARPRTKAKAGQAGRTVREGPRKLSYKEKRELEALPDRIEALEAEKQRLFERLSDPAFYKRDGEEIAEARATLQHVEAELAAKYDRWLALEEMDS